MLMSLSLKSERNEETLIFNDCTNHVISGAREEQHDASGRARQSYLITISFMVNGSDQALPLTQVPFAEVQVDGEGFFQLLSLPI